MICDTTRWRRRGPPSLFNWDPRSFSEADIDAFYEFRARFVDLKPTTDPARDRAAFGDFVRRADDAWVWVRDGRVCGTVFHRHERHVLRGRVHSFTFSEYGYTAVRGHPNLILGGAAAYVSRYLRDPRRPAYFGGFAYAKGFIPFAMAIPDVWLLGEEGMPEEERVLAAHLAAEWGGSRWDPERHVYSFATLPRETPNTPRERHRRALAHYERLNPRWSEGMGLFMLARIDHRSLTSVAFAALRRALRRRRA